MKPSSYLEKREKKYFRIVLQRKKKNVQLSLFDRFFVVEI